MEPCDHSDRKRHAQLRHDPRSAPLWVGNPQDWEMVRARPRPPLVCPEPGCNVELISYECLANKHNPRIFKFKPGDRGCAHAFDDELSDEERRRGGPMTPMHWWVQKRVLRIVQSLGYDADTEHWPTRSDVFVQPHRRSELGLEQPGFSLEVQLVPTDFPKRTQSRHDKGAQVCWLIRYGLNDPKTTKALFGLPAVRFRVIDPSDKERPCTPWEAPGDRDLARRARLEVFGTVARPPRPREEADGSAWFHTRRQDGLDFLREVLAGQRRWYPKGELSEKSGLWALQSDVETFRALERRQRTNQTPLPLAAVDAEPHSTGPGDDSAPTLLPAGPSRQPPPEPDPQATPAIDPPTDSPTASESAQTTQDVPTPQEEPAPSVAVNAVAAATTTPTTPSRPRWWQLWRSRKV